MAQWTFVDPNTLLPGDPWTSAKAQAAFENLEAVAEGAAGAPRVEAAGINKLFIGQNEASENVWFGFNNLDSRNFLTIDGRLTELRTSTNNGASWSSAIGSNSDFPVLLNLSSGQIYSRISGTVLGSRPSPINAVQVRDTRTGGGRGVFEYTYRGDGL